MYLILVKCQIEWATGLSEFTNIILLVELFCRGGSFFRHSVSVMLFGGYILLLRRITVDPVPAGSGFNLLAVGL